MMSNGSVKMANKKFTSVRNDYCLIFDKRSVIDPASDDGAICRQAFDFTPIAELRDAFQKKSIDAIGVVIQCEEKEQIKLKSGQQKSRKHITIVDDSMCSICLTVWGDTMCDKLFNLKLGDLFACKSVTISDFNGKSLNVSDDRSKLYTNDEIDHDSAKRIQRWFAKQTDEARSQGVSIEQKFSEVEALTVRPQSNREQFSAGFNGEKKNHANVSKVQI